MRTHIIASGGGRMGDHQFPLTINWCDGGPQMRAYRTEQLDHVGFEGIDPAGIVRPIAHHSGNPFVDAEFAPQPAVEITQEEYVRLQSLSSVRQHAAQCDYLRAVAACSAQRDAMIATRQYESLPPDEQESLDRCSKP